MGDDAARHAHVVDTARRITALYGFSEWQTPIFEDTAVFLRPLGETSDVVTKEMYTFADRGGDSITLRPEGTAGVCRALITGGLTQTLPQKVFYQGPMFRYERPQKGRYRQFHQIGIELLGSNAPLADAEVIACGWHILRELGLEDDVDLHLNTLGDVESRKSYRAALVSYLRMHEKQLSADSRIRLEKNPLRILDSKDEGDKALLLGAPVIDMHLSPSANKFYLDLKSILYADDIKFELDPTIVRGFDYYNHTAFEFVTKKLGAQGTVMGGGRYNGLVEMLGGPNVPGVGWGAGIERLAMLMQEAPSVAPPLIVIGDEEKSYKVASHLRGKNIAVEVALQNSLKSGLKYANRVGAKWAIIVIAEIFLSRGTVSLKNLEDGEQSDVALEDIPARLRNE